MRKLLIILDLLIVLFCNGCSCSYDGSDTAQKDLKINADFVHIENNVSENLYYHKTTKIVYWVGGSYMVNTMGHDYTTSYMTAFYAPNGLPYKYDVATNSLYEIEDK